MVSTCRKLQYLSPHQMLILSFPFFLRYYILKNPAIWLSNSILVHNSRTRILNRNGIGCEISITILIIILDYFQEKLLTKCFKKKNTHIHTHTLKHAILGSLCPNLGKNGFSWIKGLGQFLNIPIICHCAKKSEKTNDPFLIKMPHWRRDNKR